MSFWNILSQNILIFFITMTELSGKFKFILHIFVK